jgi:hypothetical protein
MIIVMGFHMKEDQIIMTNYLQDFMAIVWFLKKC